MFVPIHQFIVKYEPWKVSTHLFKSLSEELSWIRVCSPQSNVFEECNQATAPNIHGEAYRLNIIGSSECGLGQTLTELEGQQGVILVPGIGKILPPQLFLLLKATGYMLPFGLSHFDSLIN